MVLNEQLEVIDGTAVASIEKPMHAAVYKARSDIGAVIHTHPVYSSVLGVNHMELPGISEDFVQIVGEKIVCSEYALSGTPELARNVVRALGTERNAVLLPNHGTLCCGRDLREALKVSHVVEKTAQVYIMALEHRNSSIDLRGGYPGDALLRTKHVRAEIQEPVCGIGEIGAWLEWIENCRYKHKSIVLVL